MEKSNKDQKIKIASSSMKFVDPVEIIKIAGIKEGDKVADFGCGPGYFSIPIANLVGESGEVYAFDVLSAALEALDSRARLEGIDNISSQRANLEKYESSELEDESVDWVILKDILFQNRNKENILKEAHRILRKGGKILVMEWDNNLSVGPDKKLRIDPDDLGELILDAGFVFQKKADAGNFHYVVVAAKL